MHPPPWPAAPAAVVARPELGFGEIETLGYALCALVFAGFFAVLHSALLHSVPSRVLECAKSEARRKRLAPALERAEPLATSASIFETGFQVVFVVLVLALLGGDRMGPRALLFTLASSVPLLVFADKVLPAILRGGPTDSMLVYVLPGFELLQTPLAWLAYGLEALRRATMRALHLPERSRSARRTVENLREVIEDSDLRGDLDATERELIENVFEFHDVDVAEVMTPRTELHALEVGSGIEEVVGTIAGTGHSRIPVYEGTLDRIIGIAYAQDVVQLVARGMLEQTELKDIVQPASFVPETKHISELLGEFRRDRQKIAVVLDEYGGTSGIVTLGDLVEELVGEIREELGEAAPDPIRVVSEGIFDVQGNTRISEVNQELDLDLPEEEDYETLAGFVLAELGRLPRKKDAFAKNGSEFIVTDASDRRVFEVRIRRRSKQKAS